MKLKKIKNNPVFLLAILAMIVAIIYWGFLVKERYVSKANIVLQTPDIAPPELSFSSMMAGASATNTADLLYLREYLLSVDVLKSLDKKLDLRGHYASNEIDMFNRLDATAPIEFFHDYYLSKISVVLDSYSNVLIVSTSAYTANMAHSITSNLLKLGEQHMNKMGQRLANEQLTFIEKQVDELALKLEAAQQELLKYQDEQGLISPTQTTESLFTITAQLNAELIKLKAEKSALSSVMSANSPEVKRITNNIKALESQIKLEQSKMTGQGKTTLNKASADYNALLLKAQFAQEIYSNALATLEATRVEAARKLKQVSILQSPSQPEYPVEPDRVYNITISIILILLLSVILGLMLAVIRDHKD